MTTLMSDVDDPFIFTLALSPLPVAVAEARRVVADALEFWDFNQAAIYWATLVASEMVTNALTATKRLLESLGAGSRKPEISVRIFIGPNALPLLEVWDESDEQPEFQDADYAAEGGRGLHLVEHFVSQWGTNLVAGGGKCVWAELKREIPAEDAIEESNA